MGFELLLGNQRLKDNLINSLRQGRTSHCYLISGPAGSGKHTLAKLLSAALMCTGEEKPCRKCQSCRKVMSDLHPDVITVVDPEHKAVAVKLVRQIRDDVFIRPNEGEKKICIFPQELGLEGQNALLKVLEEPPAYGVFLLLTDNPEKLLPTVRSRCVELKLQPLPQEILRRELAAQFPDTEPETVEAAIVRSGGYLGQARQLLSQEQTASSQNTQFVQAYGARDSLLLAQVLVPMEKWKRDPLIEVLHQWHQLLEGALACRSGLQVPSALSSRLAAQRSGAELHHGLQQLRRCIEYARGNGSVAAICSYLLWTL